MFLLGITVVPTEIKGNGYTKFGEGGRVNKEHYGLCENGEFANPAAVTRTCFRHDVTRASRSDNFQDLINTQVNVVVGSPFHWLFKRFRKIDFASVSSGCSVILWVGVFVLVSLAASLFLTFLSLVQYLHVSKNNTEKAFEKKRLTPL